MRITSRDTRTWTTCRSGLSSALCASAICPPRYVLKHVFLHVVLSRIALLFRTLDWLARLTDACQFDDRRHDLRKCQHCRQGVSRPAAGGGGVLAVDILEHDAANFPPLHHVPICACGAAAPAGQPPAGARALPQAHGGVEQGAVLAIAAWRLHTHDFVAGLNCSLFVSCVSEVTTHFRVQLSILHQLVLPLQLGLLNASALGAQGVLAKELERLQAKVSPDKDRTMERVLYSLGVPEEQLRNMQLTQKPVPLAHTAGASLRIVSRSCSWGYEFRQQLKFDWVRQFLTQSGHEPAVIYHDTSGGSVAFAIDKPSCAHAAGAADLAAMGVQLEAGPNGGEALGVAGPQVQGDHFCLNCADRCVTTELKSAQVYHVGFVVNKNNNRSAGHSHSAQQRGCTRSLRSQEDAAGVRAAPARRAGARAAAHHPRHLQDSRWCCFSCWSPCARISSADHCRMSVFVPVKQRMSQTGVHTNQHAIDKRHAARKCSSRVLVLPWLPCPLAVLTPSRMRQVVQHRRLC